MNEYRFVFVNKKKTAKFPHLPSLVINENYLIRSIFLLFKYITEFHVLCKVISSVVPNHATKLNP